MNLGSLIVKLLLERSQFRAELAQTVQETNAAASDIKGQAQALAGAVSDAMGAQTTAVQTTVRALGVLGPVLGTVAAAAAVVGVAHHQAAQETLAYEKAIILSGNAAGVTSGQLADMARRIDGVAGTQANAAAALATMTASGKVAAENLEKVSLAAIEMERATGQSVGDTEKVFAKLGDEPVKASQRLNESMHFLTASTYAQIKAADELGEKEAAASIAQNAAADALRQRAAQVEQQLGLLERAWRGVRDVAKQAWDNMLNVGRPDTLSTQIAELRSKIDQAKGKDPNRRFSMPWDTPLADLEQQLAYLTEQDRLIRRGTEAQAERNRVQAAGIAAVDALGKANDSAMTRQERASKALDAYRDSLKAVRAAHEQAPSDALGKLLDPETIARTEAAILKQGETSVRATKASLSEYDKLVQRLSTDLPAAAAQSQAAQQGYNKAQTEFLVLAGSPAWAKFTNDQRAAVAVLYEQKIAREQVAQATEAEQKATLEAAKARDKALSTGEKELDRLRAMVTAQEEQNARLGLSKEAVADLDAAKLEMMATDLELQAIKALDRNLDEQQYELLKKQAQAYRDLAQAKRDGAARQAAVESERELERTADKAAREGERAAARIEQSLTDALMRGFESGKDFAQNLRDTVVNMFKTLVLRPIVKAIVSPVAGAITGALGLSSAAQAGQGISGVSTAISGASLLGSMGSLSAGLSYGAQSLFANGLGTTLTAGSQMLGAGSIMGGLGTLAGALGPIALGIGLLSSMFSRKLKDQGIEGTLGGDAGFEGQQYRFYEGGLFRSDKTTYSAIDPELARVLAGGFSAVQDQVTDFAEALSLPADRIKGFTTDIKVSFKGLDEAGIQKALQDALATGSNELAQQVLGTLTTTTREVTETLAVGMGDWGDGTMQTVTRTIEETTYAASEYAREGEKAIDTLTRLATSLSGVNTIWDQLGNTVYEASLAGADAASKMADAFGGLEAMAQATGAYFQNFYSAEEQRAAVERQLNEALGKLNLQLPDIDATDARAQYRALAEAQDRNTEAGREAYVVLLKLSGAFASVTAESETAAAAAARLADEQRKVAEDAARAAEEAARRAEQIARERYGLETQLMQLLGDTAGLRKREIEALDASNRALQEHIYAIEDARAAYEKSITAAQSAYSVLESSVGRERGALQSALDAERDAITARYKLQQDGHAAQLSAAQSAADKMRGIASMLSGALGRMVVESPALDRARLRSARGVIGAAAASSNVMAPGLEAALSVVTSDVRKMYGRWEDFAFDRGVTAGQTAALSSAAQSQLSRYESIVNALKAQDDVAKLLADAEMAAAQERFEIESKKLDARLEQGKSMLDRLLGIEEGTLSSVEALARLTDAVNAGNAALQAQRAAEAAARAAAASGVAGGAGPGPIPTNMERALWAAQESAIYEQLKDANFLGSLGVDAKGLAAAVADAALVAANDTGRSESTLLSDALGRIVGRDGAYVATRAVTALRDSESLFFDNDAINFSGSGYHDADKMRALERLLGVHGSHAGGLAYVPFDGYRAELHKGERVLTEREAQAYTPPSVVASMLRSGGASDAELLAELRAMRQRLEAIEAAANATAGAAVGTDRKLARVVDNDALRTREKP